MNCTQIMEEFYRDCDLLTGKNYDNISYDNCIECYRYDICKKYFDKCKEENAMSQTNEQDLSEVTLLGNQHTKYKFDYDPSILEKFEKKFEDSVEDEQIVNLDCFEFASRCPKTGQPDFATIHISYIPNKYMVESKSLKLYLFSFQQHGDFHESCIHMIMNDLVQLLNPKFLAVYGDFNSRGGISILPLSIYADKDHEDLKKKLQIESLVHNLSHRPRTS